MNQTESFTKMMRCNKQECFVWEENIYMFEIRKFSYINRDLSTHLEFRNNEWQKYVCNLNFQSCKTATIIDTIRIGSTKIANEYIDGEFCSILFFSGKDNIKVSNKTLISTKNEFQIYIINQCSDLIVNGIKVSKFHNYKYCNIKNKMLYKGAIMKNFTEHNFWQFNKTEQQTGIFMPDFYNEILQYAIIFLTACFAIILKCQQNTGPGPAGERAAPQDENIVLIPMNII